MWRKLRLLKNLNGLMHRLLRKNKRKKMLVAKTKKIKKQLHQQKNNIHDKELNKVQKSLQLNYKEKLLC